MEKNKRDNSTRTTPKEVTEDSNANKEVSTTVVKTNTANNSKKERRRKRKNRRSSSAKNSFSFDDISELNIDELFNDR